MSSNNKQIIGTTFVPFDNSYVKDIDTGELCFIVQSGGCSDYSPNDNGPFICISEPYAESLYEPIIGGIVTYEFVNVKSKSTGRVYRTLYSV